MTTFGLMRRSLLALACGLSINTFCQASDAMPNTLTDAERADGWQLLFDGQTLTDWRASDQPGTFSVKDGMIVVRGPRSHLFYMGPVAAHDFKNFEFKADLLTRPHANSGVYFHTQWQPEGWPAKGYEVQVNNSHSDPSRTGGLWGIVDYPKVAVPDDVWQTLTIRMEGRHVVTRINGAVIVDYTEDPAAKRPQGLEGRWLGSGTFALQGHDPGSETHFRNVKVKVLP